MIPYLRTVRASTVISFGKNKKKGIIFLSKFMPDKFYEFDISIDTVQYINDFSTSGRFFFFLIVIIWDVLDSQNLSPGSTSVISSWAVGPRKVRKPWTDALWNKVSCWVKAELSSVIWYIWFLGVLVLHHIDPCWHLWVNTHGFFEGRAAEGH